MDYGGVLMFGTKELYRDAKGEWRWRAVAKNHKTTGDSGEGYANLVDMLNGALLTGLILLFGKKRMVER
jgi:uncharacterized protein YegP (UPF0339 family)